MKLTKPGRLRSFAAYPRCSTDQRSGLHTSAARTNDESESRPCAAWRGRRKRSVVQLERGRGELAWPAPSALRASSAGAAEIVPGRAGQAWPAQSQPRPRRGWRGIAEGWVAVWRGRRRIAPLRKGLARRPDRLCRRSHWQSNKGMKLTRPGQLRCLAAYPQCSTDVADRPGGEARPRRLRG